MAKHAHLIAPIAFAAVGGILTGGAGWAISAGFLIGSWMFQPKNDQENQVFDPGAEEMPRFNQALRGVTIPVTFGTNRVPVHVVWQKNFTTIRHESTKGGGGGKGGGSGMGAKGGGPSATNVTYEYKWDMLFHCGMSHDEVNMFGGWVGSERLNDETLLAILNNSSAGFSSLFRSNIDRPQNASLTFEEGFFHGASPSSDSGTGLNWDHFESEENQPFRFPYTHYIGFKALNLGGNPRVPQLSFEIGPGALDLTFNSSHIDFWGTPTTVKEAGAGPSAGMILGDDGVQYQVSMAAGNTMFRVRNIDAGTTLVTKSNGSFSGDANTLGLDPLSAYSFTSGIACSIIPGKNLILATGTDIGVGLRSNRCFIIYKINSSGQLEALGGYQGRNGSLEDCDQNFICGVYGEGTDDDPIWIVVDSEVSGDHELFLWKLPSINQMKAITIEDTSSNNFQTRGQSLVSSVTEIDKRFGNHGSYRTWMKPAFGFGVPVISLDSGLPEWSTRLMFYVGKSDIEWHIDNPGDPEGTDTIYDITGTYPNGTIISIGILGAIGLTYTIDSNVEYVNGRFIDKLTGTDALPFADSGKLVDETTVYDFDDYDPTPQFQPIQSGAAAGSTLIIFWKRNGSGSADRPADEKSFTQCRIFLWNPLKEQAIMYDTKNGSYVDTDDDWGVSGAWTMGSISGWYNESTGKLLLGGYADNGGANDNAYAANFGDLNLGGGDDLAPPYIIKLILTSPVIGMGYDESVIDNSSYELALTYCDSENIKVSVQYRREENLLAVINDLLALYGGYLIDSGGKIKFGLQKFTESADLLRTIDNDHLLVDGEEAPVQITRGARQDTFNHVKVNYFDRDLEYRQNFVEISDEVDIDLHGYRPQEFPAKFVMTEALANKIAIRALWSNLYARDQYSFRLGPKDADIEPGAVVTLVDSFHETLRSGKQVRIVEWVEREPLKFDVLAVDEIQYIAEAELSALSQTQASSNTMFGPARPAGDFIMYELPKEFQSANPQVFVGYRQQQNAMGARLYTSADGDSFALVQEVQPFIISGIMADALPNRDPGYVDENIEIYLMPDTYSGAFSAATPTYCQTFALDDVSASGRALGAGLLWINSEMLAYQGVNLVGQNHYRLDKVYRGWGGTHIQGHSSGDTWHKHGGGIFNQAINEDKIGTIVHYKVAPFNFAGVNYDIASVDARTYQIQGTYFRPQNGPPLQTFVQSPGSFLTVQSEDLGVIRRKQVISGGSDVQFEWYDASRDRGYGTRGFGEGGYGRFQADTTSAEYRIEVLSSNLTTVVRCTTVSTFSYLYDIDANSTDFNGWSGQFAVRVTPFNEFGDALRSQTKILELFE